MRRATLRLPPERSMSKLADFGPKPYLGYTASMVERAAELRADAAALGGLQERADARAYVIAGELVILKKAAGLADPLFAIEQPPTLGETAEIVFLGLVDQRSEE